MQELTVAKVFKTLKDLTDSLMIEIQPLLFEKFRFVFEESLDHLQLSAISVRQMFGALTLCNNVIIEKCSAEKFLFIETTVNEIKSRFKKIQVCSSRRFRQITTYLQVSWIKCACQGTKHLIGQLISNIQAKQRQVGH